MPSSDLGGSSMRRAATTVTLILVSTAALGLAGCSGSADPTVEPTTVATTTTAEPTEAAVTEKADVEKEADASDLSLASACLSLTEPLQKANSAMLEISAAATNDAQSAVDSWRALSVAFEDFGVTAANPEVAALSASVGETGHALTDVLEKVYVEQNMDAMGEFTQANDAFFKAYQELLGLCNTTP